MANPIHRIAGIARGLLKGNVPARLKKARLTFGQSIHPYSRRWGHERGYAAHRYYLDKFFDEHKEHIHGRCLEFQDPTYAKKFGGDRIEKLDLLDLSDENKDATIVCDLTKPNDIPDNTFDCIICTHVIQLVFDLPAFMAQAHRILKPGGTPLLAAPAVCMNPPTYYEEELWRFTELGIQKLLTTVFDADRCTVQGFGNSLVTAGDFRGLVCEDFTRAELDYYDKCFILEICACAHK